ncbi:heavy metal-associated isoprenylated plant protein 35-like [Typha latifolia]|uniref:heavy metal-associated isoprenylated plant protein 35-like n=1 Tax=Typha latifolia TaxID=4733 RepID=UPI003C2D2078
MKTTGILCRSESSTAVCIPEDPRSMIMPRRPERTTVLDDSDVLINLKYSRLVESRRFSTGDHHRRRSVTLPMVTKEKRDQPKPSKSPATDLLFQVVVMKVSIHCQGCAGKIRKHISKMEGVTSFSIDLESKRVTVMGHVSPVGVLESISKVKKAEFWPC